MFAASKTDSVSGAAPDGQFNYVTMLLHGDGTNGAQNNTFIDSSSNNFTITRNGNTTQGSFSPYGSNWSNYFNGTDSWLETGSSVTALGSGNWTVEFFVCPTVSGVAQIISDFRISSQGLYPLFYINTANKIVFYLNTADQLVSTNAININTWTHVAFVKNSTTTTCYLNGVANGTYSDSNTYLAGINTFGASGLSVDSHSFKYTGYLSNYRIVVGTAVYTTAFTPPTTPLTAISGTALLISQSNRFKDNSTNNNTITPSGSPSVQRFNPFGTSTAYSTSVIGGSGYFDGSDYLTAPYNAAISLGSGNFTIEMWIYPTSSSRATLFLEGGDRQGIFIDYSNGNNGISVFATASTGSWSIINGDSGNPGYGSSNTIKLNAWNHFAFVRSGTNWSTYINGVRDLNITASGTIYEGSGTRYISFFPANGLYLNGYLSDFRIVKGTALYSGTTLTVPTAPLTAVSGTGLLLNTTNAAIFDNAMMNDLETVGNAQISTSVKKYGTGSLYFDGTGDYLFGASNPNMSFGAGDFTVEAWVYTQGTSGNNQTIFQKGRGGDSNLEFAMSLNGSNQLTCFYTTDGSTIVQPVASSNTVSLSTWTHIAISRSGSTWRCFVDGTLRGSDTYSATLYTGTGVISSGANPVGDNPYTGYIDDLRVTKGYARYTANFTAPTSALSDTGPY